MSIADQLESTTFVKMTFFVFGVSSPSSWSAILSGLNHFQEHFEDYDSSFYFPVPMFIATSIAGITLPKLSLYLSLKFRMLGSLTFLCLLLITLPIIADFFPNKNGFIICLVTVLFIGFFTSLVQNSSIGMASILGPQYTNKFVVGTGMSGVIICVLRLIALATLQKNKFLGAMINFGVAICTNLLAIFLYLQFQKSQHYKVYISEHKRSFKNDILIIRDEDTDVEQYLIKKQQDVLLKDRVGILNTFWEVNKRAFPAPLGILLNYIQTFIMFPAIALEKNFAHLDKSWVVPYNINYIKSSALIVLTYYLFDTIGKQISGNKQLQKVKILMTALFIKFLFFPLFFFIVKGYIMDEWFPFVNLGIFSLLNGFVAGGLMAKGPQMVDDTWKEKVGFIQGFGVQFGIMIGTMCAIPLRQIKQTN